MNFLGMPGAEAMELRDMSLNMAQRPQERAAARAPIRPSPERSVSEQERLDQMARQQGFNNYEEMRLFYLRRSQPEGGVSPQGRPSAMDTAMAWHPKNLFNYVNEKVRGALGQ